MSVGKTGFPLKKNKISSQLHIIHKTNSRQIKSYMCKELCLENIFIALELVTIFSNKILKHENKTTV